MRFNLRCDLTCCLQVVLPTGTMLTVNEGWDGYHLGVSLVLSSADMAMTEGMIQFALECTWLYAYVSDIVKYYTTFKAMLKTYLFNSR